MKKKREKTQINRIGNEKGEVTMDIAEIQRIMRDYHKQLYANKMDNLEEMDKFLEKHNFLRICPFLPGCPFYWHRVAGSNLS